MTYSWLFYFLSLVFPSISPQVTLPEIDVNNYPTVTEDCQPAATPTLFLSSNHGKEWMDFTHGLPDDAQAADLLEHNGTLYLLTRINGLFTLLPGEDCWQSSSEGLPLAQQDFHGLSLAAKGDRLVIGTFMNGIWISDNGGSSWRRSLLPGPEVAGSLLFMDDRLVAGTHSGVWESLDGGDIWKARSDYRGRVNALTLHKGQLVIARQNGLGVLNGDTASWSPVVSEKAFLQLIHDGDYLYATNPWEDVFRTSNGTDWEKRPVYSGVNSGTSFPTALWNGFEATPPSDLPAGTVTPTSRGWVVAVGGGC